MELLNLLLYLPGAIQCSIFVLSLVGLCLIRSKGCNDFGRNVSLAVLGTGLVMTIAYGFLSITNVVRPYHVLVHLLIALSGLSGIKRKSRIHWLAFPLAATLYVLAWSLFASVDAPFTVKATWSLDEKGSAGTGLPEEQRVAFHFGEKKNFIVSVYSDEMAKSLLEKDKLEVEITLKLLYHWGALSGYSLVSVDGTPVVGAPGGGGCENECEPAPFPRYFWAPR